MGFPAWQDRLLLQNANQLSKQILEQGHQQNWKCSQLHDIACYPVIISMHRAKAGPKSASVSVAGNPWVQFSAAAVIHELCGLM